jgi:hypothetical protein
VFGVKSPTLFDGRAMAAEGQVRDKEKGHGMGRGKIFSIRDITRVCGLSARALVLGAVLMAADCSQSDGGPSPLVTIGYDQSLNFERYRFEETVISQPENEDWTTIVGLPDAGGQGVWLVYNICEFDNPASEPPVDFTYDLSKFFVTFQDQTFFYEPMMAAFTYQNAQGLPATPLDIDEVGEEFRKETQLGENTDNVADGTIFTAPVRIAIYVTFSGVVGNAVDLELPLRYDVPPNIMVPRNQTPAKRDINILTMRRHLQTVCRPPRE